MARLDLRPNCECCDLDLAAGSADAWICTFECTYCTTCATGKNRTCPNCAGNLVQRPIRPDNGPTGGLQRFPASRDRVLSHERCNHR